MAIGNIGLQEIHLDISTKLRQKTFYANEVDTEGRGLHAFLQDNGIKVDGTGVTMQFRYKSLNDGEAKVYDFTPIGDPINGEFEIHYPSEMVRGHGNKLFPCTIVANDITSELAFENAFVYVNKAEVNTQGVEASNEHSALKQALDKVDVWDSTFQAKYTNLETQYATDLTGVKSQLAENVIKLKTKNSIPSPLRIVMHYYYEDNDEKLSLLKSLGYNCILINKGLAFLYDIPKTLAFLDKMFDNGISVMLYVDYVKLGEVTTNTDKDWMNAVKDHPAIIAFSGIDEPFDQNISVINSELAYTTIKSYTNKPVFVVDPGKNVGTYTRNCFDIFIMDIYLTETADSYVNASAEKIKRQILNRYYDLYKRTQGKERPKKFIPMFPLFAQTDVFVMPNQYLIQTMIDVYSLFNVTDYATFGFNILPDVFTSIEDSTLLQYLSLYIKNNLYKSNQDINFIIPKTFKMHKNYVSDSNMLYGSGSGNMYVPLGANNGHVIYKLTKENTAKKIFATCEAHNQGGGATHTINISVSFDGVTYEQTKTIGLPPTAKLVFPTVTDDTNVFDFPIDSDVAYVKFELVHTSQSIDATAIGFKELTCTAI